MKTKFLFALAFAFTTVVFAQKKEVKAVEKAIKSGSYGEAKSLVGAAEALMGSMDQKTKEKFLLLKGQAFLGVDNKNSEDLKVAASAFNMLKDTKYDKEATAGVANLVAAMVNSAVDDQNTQNYSNAATKLADAYNFSKKDTLYLYYAASNAVNAKDYDTALAYYNQLRELKFTGVETLYYSTEVESGKEVQAPNKQERDFLILAKTHINPTEKKTDSKSAEIAKNIALIYITQGDNDKALAAMAVAREENPDDILLLRTEADVYLKMKRMDKYQEVIEKVLEKDPNNPELYYNLGVSSDQQGNKEDAQKYYTKAVELNPKYAAAYNNLAVLILSDERAIVDEMNSLGTSRSDYAKYDELKEKRQNVYKNAMPYLEKALEARPDYLEVAKSLYGIYQQLGETSKADAVKAKIDVLEAGGGN